MMVGFLARLIAYPLAALAAIIVFIAAAAFGAYVAPSVLVLFVGALALCFGAAFFLGGFIERKSGNRTAKAYAFAALTTIALGAGLWMAVGVPGGFCAETQTGAQFWTLADGARIAYRRCGVASTDQPNPVVFLHGGPAIPPRQSTIDTLCQLGAAGFDVYLYDQLGSGQSSRLDDISGYTLARHVEDLEAIRQQLGAEKIDIVGVSWGTILASHYAARFPGRVGRAVFVSPGILGSREDIDYDHSASASSDYDEIVLPPARIIVAGLLGRINPRLAVQFMPQAEAEAAMDSMVLDPSLEYQGRCKGAAIELTGAGGERGEGANYYANLMAAQSLRRAEDPSAAIAANAPPVLLIRGVCDYIPRHALERYQAAYPVHHIVDVEGEGHSFLGSRPDIVVPLAACWLTAREPESCRGE